MFKNLYKCLLYVEIKNLGKKMDTYFNVHTVVYDSIKLLIFNPF